MAQARFIPGLFDNQPIAEGEILPGAHRHLGIPHKGLAWGRVDLSLPSRDLPGGLERDLRVDLSREEAIELASMWAGYLTEVIGLEDNHDTRSPAQKLRDLADLIEPRARHRVRPIKAV